MRDACVARIGQLAEQDERIFLITGDLGFGVLTRFAERFPRQFLNVGVAEQNMTSVATGLALEGRIVFTYSIANFPTLRCLEQLRNDAAYHGANVKVIAVGGGFSYGPLGMSHHATEDLAILRSIPTVTVLSPGCLWEAEEATEALARTTGTGYLRIDKSNAGRTNRAGERFILGSPRVLREGSDVTVAATGGILGVALQAADRLAQGGVQARVLSVPTLHPFDPAEIFRACRETGGLVTLEEHVVTGGLGGLITEVCMEAGITPRGFYRLGMRGGFSSIVGSQDYLRRFFDMDADAVVSRVREMLG